MSMGTAELCHSLKLYLFIQMLIMQVKMMDFKSILKVKDVLCVLKEIFGTYFIQKCIDFRFLFCMS